MAAGDKLEIQYELPWTLDEAGYYKFYADNGLLIFQNETLLFRPEIIGTANISGLVLEPSRPVNGGSLEIIVE